MTPTVQLTKFLRRVTAESKELVDTTASYFVQDNPLSPPQRMHLIWTEYAKVLRNLIEPKLDKKADFPYLPPGHLVAVYRYVAQSYDDAMEAIRYPPSREGETEVEESMRAVREEMGVTTQNVMSDMRKYMPST